ncbi:MAG: shikimate kinase [Bacillota bacterium]|jgi:shikimate kinase|nr:shikimate kinase [Clostridia bacterium]
MSNVVLIGFMGTGKSAIGRVVAKILGYQFVDTDQMVEEITGLTINQIFRKYGEIRFRSEESLVINKLIGKDNLVVATGGGMTLNEANAEKLKKLGKIVLLTARPEIILERVSRKNTRPLLAKGKNLDNINKLIAERKESYIRCADIIFDTSGRNIEESAEEIVKILKEEWIDEKS